MEATRAFISLAIALGLGLLVGLQRERSNSGIAGVRTFPLITMFGALCAMLGDLTSPWVVAAGLVTMGAAIAIGNLTRPQTERNPGITTEVAILLMFVVGALLWAAPEVREVPVAMAAVCAVLLHAKRPLHRLVKRFTATEMHAMMQFVLIWLVVLPVLPDRKMGPLAAINPREVWWVVVLVVGMSLVGYILHRLAPARAGIVVAGLLGGVVSSTAATAMVARRAREGGGEAALRSGAIMISIAWTVVFVRVMVEAAIAAPGMMAEMLPPLAIMLGAGVAGACVLWAGSRKQQGKMPEPQNPSELRSALLFAVIYAAVVLGVAAAKRYIGTGGLYGLAVILGLTDMDAITLSTSRLAQSREIAAGVAWRAIVLALLANQVFKAGLALVLGGWGLFRRLLIPMALVVVTGVVLLVVWSAPKGEAPRAEVLEAKQAPK